MNLFAGSPTMGGRIKILRWPSPTKWIQDIHPSTTRLSLNSYGRSTNYPMSLVGAALGNGPVAGSPIGATSSTPLPNSGRRNRRFGSVQLTVIYCEANGPKPWPTTRKSSIPYRVAMRSPWNTAAFCYSPVKTTPTNSSAEHWPPKVPRHIKLIQLACWPARSLSGRLTQLLHRALSNGETKHSWVTVGTGMCSDWPTFVPANMICAITHLDKSLADSGGSDGSFLAENWYVRAMAQHRLGHTEEAKTCMTQAAKCMESARQHSAQAPTDWIEANVLEREAETVLKSPSHSHR